MSTARISATWRRGIVGVGSLVALVAVVAVMRREPVDRLLHEGQQAFVKGDYEQAADYARRILRQEPQLTPGLHLAGRASLEAGDHQQALEFFNRIPDEKSLGAVQARCIAGQLLATRMRELSAAADQFRRALKLDPQNSLAHGRLGWLMGLSARSWEATPYRLDAVIDHRGSREQLFVLALGDLARENPDLLDEFRKAAPDDPAILLGLAAQSLNEQDYAAAEKLLGQVIRSRPEWIEPHVRMGRVLLDSGAEDTWAAWEAGLPSDAHTHPGIWAVRGMRARRQKQERVAVRCLWESVRLDPNVSQTNYQLGQALVALDRADEAAPFLERADQLQQYLYRAHLVHGGKPGEDAGELVAAAHAAHLLGLFWEAQNWAMLALADNRTLTAAREIVDRMDLAPEDAPDRCHPDFNPALRVDYSDHPLPSRLGGPAAGTQSASPSYDEGEIRFEDQAAAAGIDFQYFNGGDRDEEHIVPLYEQTGGGIGALDFDADGWPDLYLTQGCEWPPNPQQRAHLDRLYRNTARDEFVDVTMHSGIAENAFGQGVAAGDFNGDGFPDVFVANIGPNRLWQNNGDGTFTDVTAEAQIGGDAWTTSCVICDVNGDALPDAYAVNYLSGDDLFTRTCFNPDGSLRPCQIQSYAAAQDRLSLNLGDGRFADVTAEAGIQVAGGRGLGIVAADFDDSGTLDLFIANDVSPNFYFENQSSRGAERPQFAERGLLTGLAANENGDYEAGMGVAAGDVDGDGRLDLFVTNFAQESNTLYRLDESGLFADVTWRAGLKDPSLAWLGFGTQFLDADRDGDLDLVLTNGHVDDVRRLNQAYRMPPQFFRNRGDGEFAELPADQIGSYFQGWYLGRGLTRLDWNRDGREDFAVSHLDAPLALLTNTTPSTNGFLAVYLRGTASDRDAIGATVTLVLGDRTLVRQLAAGDGYHASNQRLIVFGVPHGAEVQQLSVRWPSGIEQSFADISPNREWLIIEGRAHPVELAERGSDASVVAEPSWKAGWASSVITPETSMWMAGFGNRTQPSDGTLHDLSIRVLALEDADGHRGVLLAGDLLGIPKSIYDNTCAALADRFGLDRSQVMLNSSHTHNSPVLRGALSDVYPLDDEQRQKIEAYSAWLEGQIVETVGSALERMTPVELFHGEGRCGFSSDRQWDQQDELVQNVPVLAVRSPEGELQVVVMTYACHPTSLKRAGWLFGQYESLLQKWSPDFPHFAVARLESTHPGAMAMFTQGCGGDRSAPQEGRLEKTEELGVLLAAAVDEVLDGPMQRIEQRVRTSLRLIELPFGEAPTREYLQQQLQQTGGNTFLARWATRLLEQQAEGKNFPTSYAEFPVQVWNLGRDHIWVSLGGETVSGYSRAIREQIAPQAAVLGYTNDVMAYIPTPEIIQQGQYIGQSSMAVYGVPTVRWDENIKERILGTVRELVAEVTK